MTEPMLTCTWAPTAFAGTQVVGGKSEQPVRFPPSEILEKVVLPSVRRIEALGLTHMLIAQRWWGSGVEMEASSLDCLAMTALFAAHTSRLHLVTAIHPGFFEPTAIAKWGATMDWLTNGRWSINVTSGWHLKEFEMYGIDTLTHDERYGRAEEFIDVLRGAWNNAPFSHQGTYYQAEDLIVEPRPQHPLTVFQGGQSDAAAKMGARVSDWMFINGGPFDRVGDVIDRVRNNCQETGRDVRFAMYAAPLCRPTDTEAWDEIKTRVAAIDPEIAKQRRAATGSAQGMWATDDALSLLDTNEGYAARLIGSPDTIAHRLDRYRALGIEMLHFDTRDVLFNETVLPTLTTG